MNLIFKLAVLGLVASLGNCWSRYHDPHFVGNRSVIIQMHEWRFDDLARECEDFFGPRGVGGLHVSPVNEYATVFRPGFKPDVERPWWERYQPVSYQICSRSGNESDFASMVDRCNRAGVQVYVDVVLNHMAGADGIGVCGTPHNAGNRDYPGAGFTREHFNSKEKCGTSDGGIHDWNNAWQARNCELSGLPDLFQGHQYVRDKQVDYLNRLIKLGVAGFRVDASKHMWPGDLEAIWNRLDDLNTTYFSSNLKPFAMHEVTPSSGEISVEQYVPFGKVIEFRYNAALQERFYRRPSKQLQF